MESEIWKEIKGYEGIYEISSYGNIRSIDRYIYYKNGRKQFYKGCLLSPVIGKRGYVIANLNKNNKGNKVPIHRLVAKAFIPNPNNLSEVNHKDEDKTNNKVENLEWCDRKYNMNYGTLLERAVANKSKGVCQYDLQGNLIKEWSSATEAGRNGYSRSVISDCIRGKCKTHKGYVWRYKDDCRR